MIRIACPLVVVCALVGGVPASAQEQVVPLGPAESGRAAGIFNASRIVDAASLAVSESAVAPSQPPPVASADAPAQTPVASASRRKTSRPPVLVPLYAGFATVQALDYASTTRALAGGRAREANPVMGGIVGNRAAFIGVKAAATAAVILAGEKMWKKNRVAAVVFVAALNGAVSAVVAKNYAAR